MNIFQAPFILLVCMISSCLAAKPTCKVCKDFVQSFNKRLTDTAKSNYAGGDTNWEEEKLGLYANSEVRLIEMLDNVCQRSDYDCHRLLESAEEDIERWWFKLRHKNGFDDLKQWLCSTHLDVCCPPNTFGPSCTDCPGGREEPCGGRGNCQGAEEKDGKGKCVCNSGYTGVTCQSCDPNYYNDTESAECKRCDKACQKECNGPGADNCVACAEGYENEEGTCNDIDECKEDETLCNDGTYCLNTPGKYRCQTCDKSCTVCNGPGPSKCGECSSGYNRNDKGMCEDVNECEIESLCSSGTFCENSEGSYACKACHVSCQLSCSGPGAEGCDECKSGYRMEEDTCVDIDECTNTPGPCDPELELCVNLAGSFSCRCTEGLIRSPTSGNCEKLVKKTKRKKKKSKKGKKRPASDEGEGGTGTEQQEAAVTENTPSDTQELTNNEPPVSNSVEATNEVEPVQEGSSVELPPSDTPVSKDKGEVAVEAPNQTEQTESTGQYHHDNGDVLVSNERDEL